ncbi:winged helix-turn-helix domain-containing protein, partial [Streptomyces sp. NPDC002587]
VTVHVRRLRAKIEDDPAQPRLIQTVWGVSGPWPRCPCAGEGPRRSGNGRRRPAPGDRPPG